MAQMKLEFVEGLKTKMTHLDSGVQIVTDAPKDNHGEGTSFSPSDMTSSSVAGCMLTIMAIYAKRHEIDLKGAEAHITKEMNADPRRIAKIKIDFKLPGNIEEKHRTALEHAAHTCPVHKSMHPDIEIPVTFNYDA